MPCSLTCTSGLLAVFIAAGSLPGTARGQCATVPDVIAKGDKEARDHTVCRSEVIDPQGDPMWIEGDQPTKPTTVRLASLAGRASDAAVFVAVGQSSAVGVSLAWDRHAAIWLMCPVGGVAFGLVVSVLGVLEGFRIKRRVAVLTRMDEERGRAYLRRRRFMPLIVSGVVLGAIFLFAGRQQAIDANAAFERDSASPGGHAGVSPWADGASANGSRAAPCADKSPNFSPRESSKAVGSGCPKPTPPLAPGTQSVREQVENARPARRISASARNSGRNRRSSPLKSSLRLC